jgi:hypothetical protein
MKSASQILEIVLQRIGSIYERPHMFGVSAFEIDAILWHFHGLWIDIMERDWEGFREAKWSIHGQGHICNTSFAQHFRTHTKEGASATEDEAIEFVIRSWKKLDKRLGIDTHLDLPASLQADETGSPGTPLSSEQDYERP